MWSLLAKLMLVFSCSSAFAIFPVSEADTDSAIAKATVKIVAGYDVRTKKGIACAGVIVGSKAVVTAAHCLKDGGNTVVYSPYSKKQYRVSRVAFRPGFEEVFSGVENSAISSVDLAVILVDSEFSDDMVQVHVKAAKDVGSESELLVAGFGLTTKLSLATMKVTDVSQYHFVLYDDGGGAISQGDAGAPAFVERGGIPYLYGIASLSDKGSSTLTRTYFNRIYPNIDWIDDVILGKQ